MSLVKEAVFLSWMSREKARNNYQRNKEERRRKAKEWRQVNRERLRKASRRYRRQIKSGQKVQMMRVRTGFGYQTVGAKFKAAKKVENVNQAPKRIKRL